MSTRVINQNPYLRTTRNFPKETKDMLTELDRMYVDVANCVNDRTIGIYPTNSAAVTGESWFLSGQRQQTLRKVFTVTSTAAFNHYINFINVSDVTMAYGSYTDGTNVYGFIFGSDKAISDQFSFYITSTQIIIKSQGAHPTFQSGRIVVEWLATNPNPT